MAAYKKLMYAVAMGGKEFSVACALVITLFTAKYVLKQCYLVGLIQMCRYSLLGIS